MTRNVDPEILDGACDGFNRQHRVGDTVRVKSAWPGTKLRRPAARHRKIAAPGAFVRDGSIFIALEPGSGKDSERDVSIMRVIWNE